MGLEGYIFLEWREIQNGKSSLVTKEQDYSTKISEDKSYEAVFVPRKCKINVNVNDTSYGSVKGAGEYEYGQTATIEAVAKGGYYFVHWEDNETNKNNVRSFTVTKDETFTAKFKENEEVNVAIGPDDTDKGSTNPQTGDFPEGLEISVKAIAKPGYIFSHWNDGTTCNPKTVKVTEGLSIKAIFEKATPRAMFDGLLNRNHKCRLKHNDCPEIEPKDCDFSKSMDVKFTNNVIGRDNLELGKCKNKAWPIIVSISIILMIGLFLSYLSTKCSAENTMDSLTYFKSGKTDVPVKIPIKNDKNRFIYAQHIVVDTTYSTSAQKNVDDLAQPNSQNKTSFHGDIIYRNTSWYTLLYYVIIGVLVLTAIVLAIKFLMPYYIKRADFEHKMMERQYNDYIRLADEDREYERLQYKTNVSLFEKREKAIIEEWQRDNELDRKLDIMEQERIAELNNVLLELTKVKNTVTWNEPKDSGKTVTIESSVLSNDYMNELEKIIKNQSNQTLGDHL